MFKIPFSELKERILESGKVTAEQLQARVKEKINELSGLISEEGAAHIIANELGIELIGKHSSLKIKEIYMGMRDVVTMGKVIRKFEVREFAKGDRTGKVCSIILGDETGTIRTVFWNDQVDVLHKVQEGDILAISQGYVRENNNAKELHLGDRAQVTVNPEGAAIASVRQTLSHERKKIQELGEGTNAEVVGTIVQVFDPRFWHACPRCNRKVLQTEGAFQCQEHGLVEAALSYVMNLILDDGTGTLRGVFWKHQVNHLLGKEEQDLVKFRDEPAAFEDIKTELLGEQLKVKGAVRKNDMFDRLELSVQIVERANPEEEMKLLEKENL